LTIHLDHSAEIDGDGASECRLGQALRRGGWKRADFVVTTKVSLVLLVAFFVLLITLL
jgi:aryl-alcohol dehydrogenase-like predicted oxidoreductase